MMKVSEFFIILPPNIQFILMKQIGFISSFLFCCIFAAAKIPVYIVAAQSNTDGLASMDEMPEEVWRYVADGGTEDIMMSYCNFLLSESHSFSSMTFGSLRRV